MDDRSVARHKEPLNNGASSTLLVDLAPFGMPGRFEELRAKPHSKGKYSISSIPFYPYGIAKCDIVAAMAHANGLLLNGVLERSGHRTLRVAFTDLADVQSLHDELHRLVEDLAMEYEWHAAGYLAVDLPKVGSELELLAKAADFVEKGLVELEIDG